MKYNHYKIKLISPLCDNTDIIPVPSGKIKSARLQPKHFADF